jgi:hypothetical protein
MYLLLISLVPFLVFVVSNRIDTLCIAISSGS